MLGPFVHTPPPFDDKGTKIAWAVAWLALIMGAVMLPSLVLPLRRVMCNETRPAGLPGGAAVGRGSR